MLSFELECIETIYNGEEVYYISVIGGTFGAQRDNNHEEKNNIGRYSDLLHNFGCFYWAGIYCWR